MSIDLLKSIREYNNTLINKNLNITPVVATGVKTEMVPVITSATGGSVSDIHNVLEVEEVELEDLRTEEIELDSEVVQVLVVKMKLLPIVK